MRASLSSRPRRAAAFVGREAERGGESRRDSPSNGEKEREKWLLKRGDGDVAKIGEERERERP